MGHALPYFFFSYGTTSAFKDAESNPKCSEISIQNSKMLGNSSECPLSKI